MHPSSDLPTSHGDPVDDVVDLRANIAGDIVDVGGHRWAIYGTIPVDGNVLVAEYDSIAEARSVLTELDPASFPTVD